MGKGKDGKGKANKWKDSTAKQVWWPSRCEGVPWSKQFNEQESAQCEQELIDLSNQREFTSADIRQVILRAGSRMLERQLNQEYRENRNRVATIELIFNT